MSGCGETPVGVEHRCRPKVTASDSDRVPPPTTIVTKSKVQLEPVVGIDECRSLTALSHMIIIWYGGNGVDMGSLQDGERRSTLVYWPSSVDERLDLLLSLITASGGQASR